MYKYLVLLLLVGCVRLAHIDPQPRTSSQQEAYTVKVESRCADFDEYHVGTGVAISDRHVLTAYHVVRCADIPRVWVTFQDGTRHRVVVTKESPQEDIARLEVIHAAGFEMGIIPPTLQPWTFPVVGDWVCVYAWGESECYERLSRTLIAGRRYHGDSGSPVYDNGNLVGLVINDVPTLGATRITLVGPEWLQGT